MNVSIPKFDWTKEEQDDVQAPCWRPCSRQINSQECMEATLRGEKLEPIYEPVKPTIVCNCGKMTGIGLHHVFKDGRVTASYYHWFDDLKPDDPNQGCGWHVFLTLLDYDGPEFPPTPR